MWDSGLGQCVACKKEADRDILGRCDDCFHAGEQIEFMLRPVEMITLEKGVKSSAAHIADIKARRLDTKTGKMYYDKGSKAYVY